MNKKIVDSVLIVDDDSLEFFIAKKLLESTKCFKSIYSAANGKEALHLFQNYEESTQKHPNAFPPSLILLDINMPAMNGFEFLEEYQSFTTAKSELPIPIIIMFTSSDEEIDKNRATKFPIVRDYLVKPLTFEKALKLADIYGTPTE